jgi:hypothetical protein
VSSETLTTSSWEIARDSLCPGFLPPQILTLPLFKLLGHTGLTPALRCHNLKVINSNSSSQVHSQALNGDWSLPSRFPAASPFSLLYLSRPFLPFLSLMALSGTTPITRPSIQHWSSTLVSSPLHLGFSLVLLRATEAPTGQETPSIHQLGGLTCYFLGMLGNIQVHCLRGIS